MILVTQSKASTYPYAPTRQALSKKSKEKPRPGYFRQDRGHLRIDIEHPEWVAMLKRREKEDPERILKVPKKIRDMAGEGRVGAKGKPKKRSVKGGKKKSEETGRGKSASGKTVEKKIPGSVGGNRKKIEKKKPTVKKSNSTSKKERGGNEAGSKQPTTKKKTNNYNNGLDEEEGYAADHGEDPELKSLAKAAYRADLEEQVLKNELHRFKIEQEKLKLKKEAGQLIEMSLANFIFLGYMEKMNIELLGLCKKIEPIIINMAKEKDGKGILKRFNREFQNIIVGVKKSQSDDLEEWREER